MRKTVSVLLFKNCFWLFKKEINFACLLPQKQLPWEMPKLF